MRPANSDGYLACAASDNELRQMDANYRRRPAGAPDRNPPHLFNKSGFATWRVYWGVPVEEQADAILLVGTRGQTWELCLLLAQQGLLARTASAASTEVYRSAGDRSQALARIREILAEAGKEKKVTDYLRRLISARTTDGFPPTETADAFLTLVLDYAAMKLFVGLDDTRRSEAEIVLRAALVEPARCPSEVYGRLVDAVARHVDPDALEHTARRNLAVAPLDREDCGRRWTAGLSRVDAAVDQKVLSLDHVVQPPDQEDENDHNVAAILDAVRGSKRLLIVSGEPLLGKKTRVKGVLRRLAGGTQQFVLSLRQADRLVEVLPIIVLSASAQGYRELVDKVTGFFQEYERQSEMHALKPRKQRAGRSRSARFDEAVEDLFAGYRHLPAFFVITDVEAFEFDRTRHAVRDTGIRRLIEALLAANQQSRVLVTTTDEITEKQAKEYLSTLRKTELIAVTAPSTGDLELFVPPAVFERLPSALLDIAVEIRGGDLVALAARASLAYGGAAQAVALSEAELLAIELFLRESRGTRDRLRQPIYEALIARIAGW